MAINGIRLLEDALAKLKVTYRQYLSFAERDVAWTLQLSMLEALRSSKADLQMYNNHKVAPRRLVDLAVVRGSAVETVLELKYEPDHDRTDITPGKLSPSVVYWNSKRDGGVIPDIERVRYFVEHGAARTGCSVLIDEGSYFRHREAPEGSRWENWGKSPYSASGISVLVAKF